MTLPQGVVPVPFQGGLFQMPNVLCRPIQDILGPRSVEFQIDWSQYGAPNIDPIGVAIDLSNLSNVNPLDGIRSVYVDNTFSDIIVYVFFPDTNFTLVCPAGAIVWLPVMTAGLKCTVFAESFGTDVPTTVVHLCNFKVEGFYIPATQSGQVANPVDLTLTDFSQLDGVNTNVSTFNAQTLGPPASDRLVIVAVQGATNSATTPTITSVTINGTPMNVASMKSAQVSMAGLYYLIVPLGTTGNIVVNHTGLSGTGGGVAIEVYTLTDYESAAPMDIEFALNTPGSASQNVLLSTDNGGAAVYSVVLSGSGNFALSGAIHQDIVTVLNGNEGRAASGSYNAISNSLVQVQSTNTNVIIGAAWR